MENKILTIRQSHPPTVVLQMQQRGLHSTMDGIRLRTLAVFCFSFECVNLIAPPLSPRRITVGSSFPFRFSVFGPPGSVSHKYGSGSGSFPFLISVELTEIMVKKTFKNMNKFRHPKSYTDFGSDPHPDPLRSQSYRYRSKDPDPYQNVTDLEHWWQPSLTGYYTVVFNSLMSRGLEPSSLCKVFIGVLCGTPCTYVSSMLRERCSVKKSWMD